MKFQFVGKNIDITESMKNYIQKKIEKLNKYLIFNDDVIARIVARTYQTSQKVEITIPEKFGILRAEVKNKDFYAAVDIAIDKLEKQIRRQKTRLEKRHKDSLTKTLLEEISTKEETSLEFRTKVVSAAVMDAEEAVMQMELSEHDFFAFTNSDNGKISIVYRRYNSGYGILEIN